MLSTIRLLSSLDIGAARARKLVAGLEKIGFHGLLFAAEKAIVEQAGLPAMFRLQQSSFLSHYYGIGVPQYGEVFLQDGCIMYFVAVFQELGLVAESPQKKGKSEFGVVGHFKEGQSPEIFQKFLAATKEILQAGEDQTALGLDILNLEPIVINNDPRSAFRRKGSGREPRLTIASYDTADLEISERLRDRTILELARRVSQAKSVPSADIDKAIADAKIVQKDFDRLIDLGVFAKRAVVECRQQNVQIVALGEGEPSAILENAVGALSCPKCGKPLKEERIAHLFDLGQKGKDLVQKSHWLTVLVTKALVDLGVSTDQILWNIEDGADEVDIISIFKGQEWVFESKDREFGVGDAHPFSFRRSRLSAGKAFIVTTSVVSADAKEVFKEVHRRSNELSRAAEPEPIYVEGLEQLVPRIEAAAKDTANNQARSALYPFELYSGYEFKRIVDHLPVTGSAGGAVVRSVGGRKNVQK